MLATQEEFAKVTHFLSWVLWLTYLQADYHLASAQSTLPRSLITIFNR